ncbi:hypothetical protein XELAEV_18042256mg [Xenopus laevis]|uniref:Uncharacterized protein n=1 Tax=Xenopus laevis TaxID=8355 RepID=A0A974H6B4_XENLA|nr:hypothetical protein XELAEV_18042256mg [Xenopus laevis]
MIKKILYLKCKTSLEVQTTTYHSYKMICIKSLCQLIMLKRGERKLFWMLIHLVLGPQVGNLPYHKRTGYFPYNSFRSIVPMRYILLKD